MTTRCMLPALGAILLLAACGQAPVAPLADTPQWAEAQKQNAGDLARTSGQAMSRAQAEDVESHILENPDDLVARRKLLYFYGVNGTRFYPPENVVTARRKHLLWMIEHHPEDPILGQAEGVFVPPPLEHIADPPGYEQGKRLWAAVAAKPDVPLPVLSHAAEFFAAGDWSQAEKLLLQGMARDPGNLFSARLGKLYAGVLAGTDTAAQVQVRKKLDETKNSDILAGAGGTYLQRALEIDPHSIPAHQAHARAQQPAEGTPEALAQLAQAAYDSGDLTTARADAGRVLLDAKSRSNDPEIGAAIFQANMILGLLAMHDGDRKAAVGYQQAAADAPASEALTYLEQPLAYRLPIWLLKDGERDSVVAYLKRFAKTSVVDRQELLDAAGMIQHGQKPLWYPKDVT